ncbi:TolC family protein [Chishuiella sp.]|uniref:TolC family protein n=1 Tax=Chishuiella sp. TaxID=1969467 RepID=UPI0028B22494|nr:TolC family protein [Chishuiella sp.]
MFNQPNHIKIGFCIVISLFQQLNAQTLSFTDAYERMYHDNNSLKVVYKQNETQQYITKSIKGLRYPSLNAYATGIVFDRSLKEGFNNARNGLANFLNLPNPSILGNWSIPIAKKEMAFAGFNAVWPIFTGGKINAAVKVGEIETEISAKTIIGTENHLISELTQRYFQVKLADEALIVRKQVLDGMKKHLYNATKLEENGIIAPVEKLVADVAVSESNREVLAAEKDIKIARSALANTLATDDIKDNLTSDFFEIIDLNSLEFYKQSAINNYPELQKIILQKDLADQGVKAKKSIYYPTVAAFGQTILLHNNPIGLGVLDSSRERPWAVGIGVTYNLFDGFKNKNELKAAITTRESIDFLEAKAKKDVITLVENLYFEIQKSQEEIENLKVQEKLASEVIRVRSKAFSEGLSTSTDVIDAENNLSIIRLLILSSQYAYTVSFANLLEFSGLSKEFLNYTN